MLLEVTAASIGRAASYETGSGAGPSCVALLSLARRENDTPAHYGALRGHRMASNKARARQQVGGIVSVASWGLATGSHNSNRLSQV